MNDSYRFNNPRSNSDIATHSPTDQTIGLFMSRVYYWMAIGVGLSGLTAWYSVSTPAVLEFLFSGRWTFLLLIAAQLGLVIYLNVAIRKMRPMTATLTYLFYAALTGVTLSTIFLAYTRESILNVFVLASTSFGGLALVGTVTKRDLGPIGSFCSMGLFGMLGWGLISLFFPSMMEGVSSQVYGVAGVLVFSGLTAWDAQKIKGLAATRPSGDAFHQGAIIGALTLYLDFINLFLSLLRLFGRRR